MAQGAEDFRGGILAALPRLRRFAYALAGSPDGDDLLQATVERALQKQALYKDGTDLRRWLFRLCRNLWIDEVRKRRSRGTNEEITDETAPVLDGAMAMTANMELKEAGQALDRMPEEQRAVLLLVGVEGFSYKEAADILDWPIGTVMSRLARARGRLADMLDSSEETT